MKRRTGLILALDVGYESPAMSLLAEVVTFVDAVKIGYQLLLSEGLQIIRSVKKEYPYLPVIADLKIMDAPHMAKTMVTMAMDAGCDIMTVCGACGPSVLEGCVLLTRQREKKLLVFVEFTQADGLIGARLANSAALLAKEKGAYGIMAPGTKPNRVSQLRKIVGNDLVIVSCGIGAQGPDPGSAIEAGADFEIVGRRICIASNHRVAAASVADSLSAAIDRCS